MAGIDNYYCDLCGQIRVFQDWDIARQVEQSESNFGQIRTICNRCSVTHEVVVVPLSVGVEDLGLSGEGSSTYYTTNVRSEKPE